MTFERELIQLAIETLGFNKAIEWASMSLKVYENALETQKFKYQDRRGDMINELASLLAQSGKLKRKKSFSNILANKENIQDALAKSGIETVSILLEGGEDSLVWDKRDGHGIIFKFCDEILVDIYSASLAYKESTGL